MANSDKHITITVLYDNDSFIKGLKSDWGFSCFIKGVEKTILFDTGGNGEILLENMEKLGIKPEDIQVVFFSHIHGDHTGGLWNLLEKNSNVSVYVPASFPEDFKKKVRRTGAQLYSIDKETEILNDIYSTGEMGTSIFEQSLVINSKKGLIVITGCAHPGIVNIVKKAKETISRNVYFVMGGFHLLSYSTRDIKEIILDFKELGVQKVGPTHCSGSKAKKLFQEAFGDNFIQMGAGKVIEVRD